MNLEKLMEYINSNCSVYNICDNECLSLPMPLGINGKMVVFTYTVTMGMPAIITVTKKIILDAESYETDFEIIQNPDLSENESYLETYKDLPVTTSADKVYEENMRLLQRMLESNFSCDRTAEFAKYFANAMPQSLQSVYYSVIPEFFIEIRGILSKG